MKKPILLIIYCLLFTVCSSYAQVPADSLPGTYAGQYWYANPATSPWVITPDTVIVTSIDTINCTTISYGGCGNYGGIQSTLFKSYSYCISSLPTNFYVKFYSLDSINTIDDNIPNPPPSSTTWSIRFYGSRINNKITSIHELINNKQLFIYPSPCNGILTIECKINEEETEIIITDAIGKIVKSQESKVKNGIITLDVGDLKSGIYILQIRTEKETLSKKIIIN